MTETCRIKSRELFDEMCRFGSFIVRINVDVKWVTNLVYNTRYIHNPFLESFVWLDHEFWACFIDFFSFLYNVTRNLQEINFSNYSVLKRSIAKVSYRFKQCRNSISLKLHSSCSCFKSSKSNANPIPDLEWYYNYRSWRKSFIETSI